MNLNDKLSLRKQLFLENSRKKLFKKQIKEITRDLYKTTSSRTSGGYVYKTVCDEDCLPEVIEYFKKQGITHKYDWSDALYCRADKFYLSTPINEKELTELEIIKLTEQSKTLDVLFLIISIIAMMIIFTYQTWLLFIIPTGCLAFNLFKRKSFNSKIRVAQQKQNELMEPEWDKIIEEHEIENKTQAILK